MRTVSFKDGGTMPWPTYRAIMLGEISPQAAVARTRREPGGAYDQAMRRGAHDQNGGRLDASYCRATDQFLHNSGLADEDVEAVMQILGKYIDEEQPAEDSENMTMADPKRVPVGPPRGPVGTGDRRFALDELDQYGQPRRNLATPMPLGADDGFSQRFPEAARIRTA